MPDKNDIRQCMIEALGLTNGMTTSEVAQGLTELGSDYMFELDSKTAEFLLVSAEIVVGHDLPCPADLGEDRYATLGDLIDIVVKEL
ncbi:MULTISPECIES: hypothetical protein [unclassified Rhodococcus (in: high G+C Gram-positive bacteria)]|uniref:hypothetical protein n=1 Tax=unclassified Rhodococcus (in: high G+C Gram-positive bacteria) TaxID=192944 RepID=UPI00117B6048|nr:MULTISPECIES: hypothetical protein [unclassified Rhodococcus (in: high G+C Gram-positive bacteria)]